MQLRAFLVRDVEKLNLNYLNDYMKVYDENFKGKSEATFYDCISSDLKDKGFKEKEIKNIYDGHFINEKLVYKCLYYYISLYNPFDDMKELKDTMKELGLECYEHADIDLLSNIMKARSEVDC